MTIYITSSADSSRQPDGPPKCRTDEERAARTAESERRRVLNAQGREEARQREALRDAKRPASSRRFRERSAEEEQRQGDARDKLHAALDVLADRQPTADETRALLALASQAFGDYTAMGRLLVALVRLPALAQVLRMENRPPDKEPPHPKRKARNRKGRECAE